MNTYTRRYSGNIWGYCGIAHVNTGGRYWWFTKFSAQKWSLLISLPCIAKSWIIVFIVWMRVTWADAIGLGALFTALTNNGRLATGLAGKVLSTCAASVGQHAQPFLQLLGLVIQPLLWTRLTGAGVCYREHTAVNTYESCQTWDHFCSMDGDSLQQGTPLKQLQTSRDTWQVVAF